MFGYDAFSHYLSFGSTDQETSRELRESYTGLVVPGTVAAFQKQGTGGFVLSLSAASAETPYLIDPRFPLFQQLLMSPKKSHTELARVFEDEDLIQAGSPRPVDFDAPRIQRLAERWVAFNETFHETANEKFNKYAMRLEEPVSMPDASAPELILAPYFVALNENDAWWELSSSLFDACVDGATTLDVVRVVAVDNVPLLPSCLGSLSEGKYVVWVSGLNELEASQTELGLYAETIASAQGASKVTAALYGGFFSVLLGTAGLVGSSHGIGFGEFREWRELPQSGPPPARFYVPTVHRYVGQEDADELFGLDPQLVGCECEICGGDPPLTLDYHDLMKHSVLCRSAEINEWTSLSPAEAVGRLNVEWELARQRLRAVSARATALPPRLLGIADHLPRWASALAQVI